MRSAYTILLWIFTVFFVLFTAEPLHAQVTDGVLLEAPKPRGDIRLLRREPDIETFKPVAERTPTDLEPIPIRYHGFEIYPVLQSAQSVDTNIFATDTNEEVDTITILEPSLFIEKDLGRHAFNASVGGELRKYWSNSNEDVFNFDGKFGGVLEARQALTIPFEFNYISGHEKRGQNFTNNFSVEPIAFNSFHSALGLSYHPNRLGLSVLASYGELDFKNGTNRAGQAVIREDGDRSLVNLEATASYELLPNHQPFLSLSYGFTDYDKGTFDGTNFSGPERDSTNIEALAGWQLSYKGFVQGYLGIGYGARQYDSDQIEDIDSLRVSSNIDWNFTKHATLNLSLRRAITEDNQITQGIILSQGRVGLDYEFLHNLFYSAYGGYTLADFQGSTRQDDIYRLGTGVRYVATPRFTWVGDYDYSVRESTARGVDYSRHQFMVRLNTRF